MSDQNQASGSILPCRDWRRESSPPTENVVFCFLVSFLSENASRKTHGFLTLRGSFLQEHKIVSYFFDKDSTPRNVVPLIMSGVHGNVGNIVARPFWKEVREGDSLAVAFHQVPISPLWGCSDLDVSREWDSQVLELTF